MAVYDVREGVEYDTIVFADDDYHMSVAAYIDYNCKYTNGVAVRDTSGDFVRVISKQHARNMIKALEKAIDFGWLK